MEEARLYLWKKQLQRSPTGRLSMKPAESLVPGHRDH